MEPFKWDIIPVEWSSLGMASYLLSKCLESTSDTFWNGLKSSHQILKKKYALQIKSDQQILT